MRVLPRIGLGIASKGPAFPCSSVPWCERSWPAVGCGGGELLGDWVLGWIWKPGANVEAFNP